MAELGFGPTLPEMQQIVKEYVVANGIETSFKNNTPGYDWAVSFMKRHRLSLKKSGLMQIARKNVTSDPFVIYGFYDMLQKEVERLGIKDHPECFWNCDESGFPTDPSRWKTVGPVGSKTVRVTCGPNRENITVLAVCSANGNALDPLVIFKGKNLQSTWRGKKGLPDTFYGVSDSGWMTTKIFNDWFQHFAEKTKDTRPLLLLFDGHLTHMSIDTIDLAIEENISIIKLPAHCTDLLQPLDVCCFSPLKCYYEKLLSDHVHKTGAREPLQKRDFVDMVCTVWHDGLSEKNVKAGFSATGIYPVDKLKYKIGRLDQIKLKTYNKWKAIGSPLGKDGSPDLTNVRVTTTPLREELPQRDATNMKPTSTPNSSLLDSSAASGSSVSETLSPNSSRLQKEPRALLGLLQKHAPPGMKYSLNLVPTETETSFEEIIRARGRPANEQQTAKRQRMSMHGAVLTDENFRNQIKDKEDIAKAKEQKKQSKLQSKKDKNVIGTGKGHAKKRFKATDILEESSEDENNESFEAGKIDPNCEETYLQEESEDDSDMAVKQVIAIDEENIGQYYAVFWKKPRAYYWGKLQKVFADDADDDADSGEFNFLQRKGISTDPSRIFYDWPTQTDMDIVDLGRCFYGPTQPIVETVSRGKTLLKFECEADVMEAFKNLPM